MSQIASAYVVSAPVLDILSAHAENAEYDKFRDILGSEGHEIEPAYGHSGYVVAVAVAYLDENGVGLHVTPTHPAAKKLAGSDMAPMLIVNGQDAHAAATLISELNAPESDLREYYEEFTEDQFPEAGSAMREAIEYIMKTLTASQTEDQWSLLFVG